MITADIQQFVREQVANEVAFRQFDDRRMGVALPLTFGDGDACEVVLEKQDDGKWLISDEGHVVALGRMQGVNLLSAGYADRFRQLAGFYGLEEHQGEVRMASDNGHIGDSLFLFCQACLELARLTEQPPDEKRKRKKFSKRFARIVEAAIPKSLLTKNWFDEQTDPNGIYRADYRANDWLIFGAGSPSKVWKSTATVQHHKASGVKVQSVFAFSESTAKDASAFAALADNATHKFSIDTQRQEFEEFLRDQVRPMHP